MERGRIRGGIRLAALLTVVAMPAATAQEATREDPLAGFEVSAKEIGWAGIRVGMSFVQAERRASSTLPLVERKGARCGSWASAAERDGLTLELGFSGSKPGAKIETIFVRFEGYQVAANTADLVAALRRHAPAATYVPDPALPDQTEADDLAPVYELRGERELWAVHIRPRDGLLIARRDCLR